jgi:3-dehydroquinate synthase
MPRLLKKESSALAYAIQQSCLVKVDIVTEDEKEVNTRALLNLGHTFGHAIEQIVGYGKILHGEAVSIGMVLAAMLSEQLGWIDHETVNRVKKVLTMAKLPIRLPNSITVSNLMNGILLDKKTVGARPRFVLLKSLGLAAVTSEINDNDIAAVVSKIPLREGG